MTALRVRLSGAGPAGLGAVQAARSHDDCDVVAVHDRDPAAARRLARGSGLGFATGDFDELLGYGVDFVVLTGPLADRVDQVRRAAEQAVPCLVHAPMAPDLAAAREMAAVAAAHEVRLGVCVPGQADPVVEQTPRRTA